MDGQVIIVHNKRWNTEGCVQGYIQKFPDWVDNKTYADFCYWSLLSPSE
jgi:hypothetical protein